eukprot:1914966-Prorocentrum_lima.AAC.1
MTTKITRSTGLTTNEQHKITTKSKTVGDIFIASVGGVYNNHRASRINKFLVEHACLGSFAISQQT